MFNSSVAQRDYDPNETSRYFRHHQANFLVLGKYDNRLPLDHIHDSHACADVLGVTWNVDDAYEIAHTWVIEMCKGGNKDTQVDFLEHGPTSWKMQVPGEDTYALILTA